jgi:hypothetical protein
VKKNFAGLCEVDNMNSLIGSWGKPLRIHEAIIAYGANVAAGLVLDIRV